MKKLIIDTDPGVDDALAIMYAAVSGMPLVGLTTTYGNASVEDSSRNALAILSLVESNAPVYQGSDRPLEGSATRAESHGENGLGNVDVSSYRAKASKSAQAFLAEQLEKNGEPVDIIAIGPLTNIARTLQEDPARAKKISQLIVLGGVFNEPGNISPYAEFNVYNDPLALKIVLEIVPNVVVIPADVCRKVMFTNETFMSIRSDRFKEALLGITSGYIQYYQTNDEYQQFTGGVMYDLLAVMYYEDPSLFRIEDTRIQVETTPGERYGETTIAKEGIACRLVRDADADRIEQRFITAINNR